LEKINKKNLLMLFKFNKKTFFILSLISILSFVSCDALDELSDSADETANEIVEEMLGISAFSEDLNKTSTNYNEISNIGINNQLVSSSEVKMKLPSSVPVSYTKKKYTLTGSMWNITTNSYSTTVSRTLFNRTSNLVKVSVQNDVPTLYVNSVAASTGSSGGTGGGSGSTSGEIKLIDQDVTGNKGDLKIVSFTVPSGVKTMVVKTNEPNNNYRNLADLFVRRNSPPSVSVSSGYSWTADYSSRTPNREIKICTISNPSSGTWYAGLYGYNMYFTSRLTVTITK
jgi:hypothetical protein